MDIELMILGFLMSGPKTGYRLKAISGKLIMFYSITLNKIYPVLRKLEGSGYIKKEIVFQTGKPNKHLYSLTPARDIFSKSLKSRRPPWNWATRFLLSPIFSAFWMKTMLALNSKKRFNPLKKH
jgi:hypothetical protein